MPERNIPDNHDVFAAEEHAKQKRWEREVAENGIGICEYCGEPVLSYDDYYNVDGKLIHGECGLDWLWTFQAHGRH